MKKVILPSGVPLEIGLATFSEANKLMKSVAKELKDIKLDTKQDLNLVLKDLILSAIASEEIEKNIFECMKRCTYNGLRITHDTFEAAEARQDFFIACYEVALENLSPFLKSLYVKLNLFSQDEMKK